MHSVFVTGAKSMFNAYTNVSQRTYIRYVNNKMENARVHVDTCRHSSLINTSDTYNIYIISSCFLFFLWISRIAVFLLYTFFSINAIIETIPLIDTIAKFFASASSSPVGTVKVARLLFAELS